MRPFGQCIKGIVARVLYGAVILASWLLPAHGGELPFLITIRSEQPVLKTDEDIRIRVVLTNTSDQDIWSVTPAECQYEVYVWDSQHLAAHNTEYGLQVKNKDKLKETGFVTRGGQEFITPCMMGSTSPLKPTNHSDVHLTVSDLYDMSRPGQYTIQVQRTVPKERGGGVVKSNIITVTVTQ